MEKQVAKQSDEKEGSEKETLNSSEKEKANNLLTRRLEIWVKIESYN